MFSSYSLTVCLLFVDKVDSSQLPAVMFEEWATTEKVQDRQLDLIEELPKAAGTESNSL